MKLAIVNEADRVIGAKEKSQLQSTDIYRVARVVIINSKGQLLLAQRALSKQKDPGLWGLAVEGTVEDGEGYETNIRKEAQEEIGIDLGQITVGPHLRMTGKYNHHCQFFVYKADLDASSLRLQKEELARVKWCDPRVLRDEINNSPEKFGYNFRLILETIWPLLDA